MMRSSSRAPLFAIGAAGFLVALKAAGAHVTGSLALGSAALDSLIDVFMSSANFLVVRKSVAPPDYDHAWGHGKFEDVAALVQGLFLGGAGTLLVVAGIERLISGEVPRRTGVGIGILLLSILVSLVVARRLKAAASETGSPALKADSLHYSTDLWVNGSALLALGVVRWTGWWQADPIVALVVAIYVFRTAASLAMDSLSHLTDRALPEEEIVRIEGVVASFRPDVRGMHDLKTRRSGRQRFIEFHVEIPRATSFERAHDLMVEIIEAVEREFPRSSVTVHGDPV